MIDERWMFWTNFVCQSISLVFVVCMYLGIDSFMFGAIYAVGGQIDLLNWSLNSIGKSTEESKCNGIR